MHREVEFPGDIVVLYYDDPDYSQSRHLWPTHQIIEIEGDSTLGQAFRKGVLSSADGTKVLDDYLLSHGVDPRDAYDKLYYGMPCAGPVRAIPRSALPKGYVSPDYSRDKSNKTLRRYFNLVNDLAFGGYFPPLHLEWVEGLSDWDEGEEPTAVGPDVLARADCEHRKIFLDKEVLRAGGRRSYVVHLIYHELLHLWCPPLNPLADGHHSGFLDLEERFPGYSRRQSAFGFE